MSSFSLLVDMYEVAGSFIADQRFEAVCNGQDVTQAVTAIHTRSKLKEVCFRIVMRLVPLSFFWLQCSLVGGKNILANSSVSTPLY